MRVEKVEGLDELATIAAIPRVAGKGLELWRLRFNDKSWT
jgi:hypothetical protein